MNKPSVSCLATLSEERREDFWASLALRYTNGIGCRTAKRLLVEFGSASAAMKDIKNWSSRASISARVVQAVLSNQWREAARKEWDNAGQVACEVLLWADEEYPELLREIPDPPLFLYAKGDVSLLKNPSIGVVGSRRCSKDGIRTAEMLSRTLSASGVTTVSGLARGIDSVAHSHALSAWGSTVAVLGTGISHVYPPENSQLFFDVAERGVIVSEFSPNMPPEARNFPLRNRIISGLSLGVLVIEAAPKSGSLITARHALEQGREVFAVPGRMQSSVSSGCHDLIRQGATAVFSCDDILVSIAPLLGISLDNFTRSGDSAVVRSSSQPSAVAPVPEVPELLLQVAVDHEEEAEPEASQEIFSAADETNLSARLLSPECSVRGGDEASPDCTDISDDFDKGYDGGATASLASIEEQLRAIPEVIEIPLSPVESEAENVVGDSSSVESEQGEAHSQIECEPYADEEITLPQAKLRVHADVLPLEQKRVDSTASLEDQLITLLTGEESLHIDILSRMLSVPTSQVSTALLMLEVGGLVKQVPGMKYRKV